MTPDKREPVLCYVDDKFAYFTTQELAKQWGDDWDDAPYEHNAGEPYGPCWHNEPEHRNSNKSGRGWKRGTKTPLDAGELCRCESCVRDWNEDGSPRWEIIKVAFDGDMEAPSGNYTNSPYSVQAINAGVVAWLRSSSYRPGPVVAIPAGTTLERFAELVHKAGGRVYVAVERMEAGR